jgi:hypothetical protein
MRRVAAPGDRAYAASAVRPSGRCPRELRDARLARWRLVPLALVALCAAVLAPACGGTSTSGEAGNTTEQREDGGSSGASGLRTGPTDLQGTELVVRGELDGVVSDPAGNVLGTDAAAGIERVSAPHGSFDSTGDGGQFFLLTAGPHRGSWRALGDGEVTFVVRNHAGDGVEETAATLPVALRESATVTLDLSSPAALESLELAIDDDGDGRADRSVGFGAPVVGAAAADLLQPVSHVDVEHVMDATGKRVARVTISARDRGGAGIARTEYALDASGTSDVYTGPFEAPAVGQVIVRSIDRAGNIEAPYARVRLD